MSIFPVAVVAIATMTVIFWILKHCFKWNIFGVTDDKSANISAIFHRSQVESSKAERKPQIEALDLDPATLDSNQEPLDFDQETLKESPHKSDPLSISVDKNGEENEDSSKSEDTANLSKKVKKTDYLSALEKSSHDGSSEEPSLGSIQLESSISKHSPIIAKKTLPVKQCSVIVQNLKVPINKCGVFLEKLDSKLLSESKIALVSWKQSDPSLSEANRKNFILKDNGTPISESSNENNILKDKASSITNGGNKNLELNDKTITRRKKSVSSKENVAPKVTGKKTAKKPIIEMPSPISINNNNSATKKKKKLFSLNPQKSEIFTPVEEFSEVDPHQVVMKQLRERRPKRK